MYCPKRSTLAIASKEMGSRETLCILASPHMVEIERGPGAALFCKRCSIRFRSGDLSSAVDEAICADEATAARKTRTGNQSLGVLIFVISAS